MLWKKTCPKQIQLKFSYEPNVSQQTTNFEVEVIA
jgi:hypothetical protein